MSVRHRRAAAPSASPIQAPDVTSPIVRPATRPLSAIGAALADVANAPDSVTPCARADRPARPACAPYRDA